MQAPKLMIRIADAARLDLLQAVVTVEPSCDLSFGFPTVGTHCHG